MSDLRVGTISDAAGTGPVTLTGQYAAKAWVNFNGTGTVAIRDSGNVSSLTDNGAGNYTVNFTNAFGAADFAIAGCTGGNGANPSTNTGGFLCPQQTASTFVLRTGATSSDADVDREFIFATTHGDLA